jgi:hypothetical protein
MNVAEIQEKIDSYHYWDAWVISLSCDHFADEITLLYEDSDGNIQYRFMSCYKSTFDHALGYHKEIPTKELLRRQLPYCLHDVKVCETELENQKLYNCKICMSPMDIEIWCKEIEVSRLK